MQDIFLVLYIPIDFQNNQNIKILVVNLCHSIFSFFKRNNQLKEFQRKLELQILDIPNDPHINSIKENILSFIKK
jgi:hypothetical protein